MCVGEDDPEGVGEVSGRCDGPGCEDDGPGCLDAGCRTCGRFRYLPFDEEGLVVELGAIGAVGFSPVSRLLKRSLLPDTWMSSLLR